jgi:hypothetical protein
MGINHNIYLIGYIIPIQYSNNYIIQNSFKKSIQLASDCIYQNSTY